MLTSEEIQRDYFQRTKKAGTPPVWLIACGTPRQEREVVLPESFSTALYEAAREWICFTNPPRKALAYVIDSETQEIADALAHFATCQFDYLCAPADVTAEEAAQIASWVKSERLNDHLVKAVLPDQAADSEGIVNFTGAGIQSGGKTYDAAGYCARVAGLLAGTPMTISCTYAPLPEVRDVARLTKSQLDAAIDGGELIMQI